MVTGVGQYLTEDVDFNNQQFSVWDSMVWMNYHLDYRYVMHYMFGGNEAEMFQWFTNVLSDPFGQINVLYGTLEHNGTLLRDYPGYSVMSPLVYQIFSLPGGKFAPMVEPLKNIYMWEKNASGQWEKKVVDHEEFYGIKDAPGMAGLYDADVPYMKALLYNDTGFLDNIFYLALSQDSRYPDSIWAMMNEIQRQEMGFVMNDTTMWNTKPLDINRILTIVTEQSEESGDGGGGMGSFMIGIDFFEMLSLIQERTKTTLGDLLDAAGITMYDVMDYIITHWEIKPEEKPAPFSVLASAALLNSVNSSINPPEFFQLNTVESRALPEIKCRRKA
jgi:hypothetical protein